MGRQFRFAFSISDLAMLNAKSQIRNTKRPRGVGDAHLSAKEEDQVQVLARIPLYQSNSSKH